MKKILWVVLFYFLAIFYGAFPVQSAKSAPASHAKSALEFPPGLFTDGGNYHISDYKGKVVVLWFFYTKDPVAEKTLPPIFKLMLTYKDKPVIFFGVAPHATFNETTGFVNSTGSGIPSFADTLGIMAAHCGVNAAKIASDPEQFRIIGPNGAVVAHDFTEISMTAALTKAHFLFKDNGYDKSLDDVVELLEHGDYVRGALHLEYARNAPIRKTSDPMHGSADKLFAALHKIGEGWKAEIDTLPLNSVDAYVVYKRLQDVFPNDPLGQDAAKELDKLKENKDFLNDRNAYNNFQCINKMMSNANITAKPKKNQKTDRERIRDFCDQFVKAFPDTTSANVAHELLSEIK